MPFAFVFFYLLFFVASAYGGGPQAGDVDQTFTIGSTVNREVTSIIPLNTGKIIIAGGFSTVHGAMLAGVARLNADGTTDPTFSNGLSNLSSHLSVAPGWACVKANVRAAVLMSNGKILVGGQFIFESPDHSDSFTTNVIVRLNADGSLDPNFSNPPNPPLVTSLTLQPDEKILLADDYLGRPNVARLNSDGSLDATFGDGINAPSEDVRSLALQPDGKVIIVGPFRFFGSTPRGSIARLNADGSLDTGFLNGMSGASLPFFTGTDVLSVAVQTDGKVLVSGRFNAVNGVARVGIARLNSNGSVDTGFQNGMLGLGHPFLSSGFATRLAVQSDGKIIISGVFDTVNGVTRKGFARLNADGSLDTDFQNVMVDLVPSGTGAEVLSLALQSGGKILIGGRFSSVNGVSQANIVRLNADGTLDTGFNNGPAGINPHTEVSSIVIQTNGQVLAGGTILISAAGQTRSGLARFNADGSLDAGFQDAGLTNQDGFGSVSSLALQPDGKVLITGNFVTGNGTPRKGIARLNVDGSVDPSFQSEFETDVVIFGQAVPASYYRVALQPDGKMFVLGSFYKTNSFDPYGIARFHSDGTLDVSFQGGLSGMTDGSIFDLALQPDGKILVGGVFSTINGATRRGIARLNANGSLDTGFQNGMSGVAGEVTALALRPDGKITIVGHFPTVNGLNFVNLARLNPNGSVDLSFNPAVEPNNNGPCPLAIQPDGKALVWTRDGVVVRLNVNGSLDSSFRKLHLDPFFNVFVQRFALQPDGKVLVGGLFSGVNGVAGSSLMRLYGSIPQPFLTNFNVSGNQFQFDINGVSNQVVVVEASTNLLHWTALTTNSLGAGLLPFSDPALGSISKRFYRVGVQP